MDWWWNLLAAMDEHDGQAAWAQAVGSILAIISGFAVAIGQAHRAERHAEKLRKQETEELRGLASTLMARAFNRIESTQAALRDRGPQSKERVFPILFKLQEDLRLLQSFDITKTRDPSLINNFMRHTPALESAAAVLNRLLIALQTSPPEGPWAKALEEIEQVADILSGPGHGRFGPAHLYD